MKRFKKFIGLVLFLFISGDVMPYTILVTGGAGYIGSHTSLFLHKKGYNVIILDNFSTSPANFNPSWATVIRGDYSDSVLLDTIFTKNKIDAVMHFGGFIQVGESVIKPDLYYVNNVAKSFYLLQAMLKNGVKKFVFSSSSAVYGTPQFLPLTEDHPKLPINPYGKSKLMLEMVLDDLEKSHGLKFVALRYFNAAGAVPEEGLGERHEPETHLIPLALKAALENKTFKLFGTDYNTRDGSCIRDFFHVWDIADAHWRALLHLLENKPSEFINLGTGKGFSVKEVIKAAEDICKTKIKIIETDRRAGDPAILVADSSRARDILNWEPKYSDLKFIIRSAFVFHSQIEKKHTGKEIQI